MSRFIDLHSHTTASDGSFTPHELVDEAVRAGLTALAITDHDTFAGFEKALPYAEERGLEMVRGIELSARSPLGNGFANSHILAYFVEGPPAASFLDWLEGQRQDRLERNRKLVASLRDRGVEISLDEVESVGKSLTGRPHFAKILVQKGYARSHEDAFRRYLGESAPTYVERESPMADDAVGRIRSGGGIPVLAHPIRLHLDRQQELLLLAGLKEAGLLGLEVQHSDQDAAHQRHYQRVANDLDLMMTGGSDFHGAAKPDIALGSGRGNVRVPYSVLERLKGNF